MKKFCRQLNNSDAAVFSVMNQAFLFSANTLTYFPITECAKDLLTGFEDLKTLEAKYSRKEIEKTRLKLNEFELHGIISPVSVHEKGELFYRDYYLKLVQSTRCNLSCSYCFAQKDKSFDMSVETAKKAILFFIEKFVPKGGNRRYIIDLTGAGEPLLRLNFILAVNDFVLQLKKERGINIFCQLATNGMLLSKETSSLLKEKCILFGVSLDGSKEISEKNRRGLKYEVVSKNINDLENRDFFGLAATYSGNNHDFVQIFKMLSAFKPEVVGMKPVRLSESEPNSINMKNIEDVKDSYDKFAKWIYKQLAGGRNDIFDSFMKSEDYFVRFLKATVRPFRLFYRCSAGISGIAVDSKENIIICPAFIGKKDGIIGNLTDGIEELHKKLLENLYADKISGCKNCWARYTCAGECFAESNVNGKALGEPVQAMCELKKYLIQLSVWFWTSLRFEHNEIYRNCIEKY